MNDRERIERQPAQEIEALRSRLAEAEEALRAIQSGEVDALVVYAEEGERVYTLQGADYAYRVMVESMNEGAATMQIDGTILYSNGRLARMLAVPLEKLAGSSLLDYLDPSEQETFVALARKGIQSDGRAEFTIRRGDDTRIPVLISVAPAEVDHERGICLIATDLTEQKRSEEIASAERMARSILDQAAESIVVCDRSGTIIRASRAANQILQQSPLFQPFEKMFPIVLEGAEEDGTIFSVQDVLAGQSFKAIEARLDNPYSKTSFYVLLSATPLRNDTGGMLGCIVSLTDITQRRQAEAALREREMQHRLMDQREQERVQIARNLHDGPLQDLLSLSYTVQSMSAASPGQEARDELSHIRESLVKLAGDLRNVCNELRPPILARFGLAKAIRAHAEDFQGKFNGLALNLDLMEDGQTLPDGIRMALFRIYQEGLNNVIHHAEATEVRVKLSLEKNNLYLEVQDNGKGFREPDDWVDLVRLGHLGLVGMKERVEALNGKLKIHSRPGEGTTIWAEIPWVTDEV